MPDSKYHSLLFTAAWLLLAAVIVLWSWNTLAELFAAPTAQYKHALAATALLALVKWTMAGAGRTRACQRHGGAR